ncbi:MAG: ABC transporter permease [Alistipes sp.]|nr:ABC transporter permease [Alistipes sp.]
MMRVEYMLAERMARYEKGSRATVMMRLATMTVGVGVAAMLLTLAVVGGFRYEIDNALKGLAADVMVSDVSGMMNGEPSPVVQSEGFVEEVLSIGGVKAVSRQVSASGMAKSGDNVAGLQIKGIGPDYDSEWWADHLVEGTLPDIEAEHRSKELLLSSATARSLGVHIGDKIEMLFASGEGRARRDRFKVVGLYNTGLEEMDSRLALADVRDVRRIADWDDEQISAYEVMLYPKADADEVSEKIYEIIDRRYDEGDESVGSLVATTLQERYPVVFDWFKAHDINARVILIIIMLVVLLNMATTMLIMVLDRTGMIGSLKALGMRNGAIRRMFVYRAVRLFLKGALWGNAVALALIAVQAVWHPIELDASGYMLAELPVRLKLWWVVALNVAALAVMMVAMLLPSAMVLRVSPAESLKYKQ